MDVGTRIREVFGIGDIQIGVYLPIGEMTTTPLSSDVVRIIGRDKTPEFARKLNDFCMSTRIFSGFVAMHENAVRDLRTRDNHIHIMLTPETFFYDIEMQKPEKTTSKSVSERGRGFVFSDERGIIQCQFFHGVLEFRIFVSVDGIDTCEDIWSDSFKTLDGVF
jgi:hypothetical protein